MKKVIHNAVGAVGFETVVLFALAVAYLLSGDSLSLHYVSTPFSVSG